MHEFNTDKRQGRLMMLCLSPYVNCGDAMTSFGMAELILQEYVPDAICVVVHGGGVNALYNPETGPGGASTSSDYSTGCGERIFNKEGVRRRHGAWQAGALNLRRQCNQRPQVAKQASIAIKEFDERYSLKRPIIVIGYNVIGRCASIRSRKRVITHIISGYQKARNTADLEQMALRGNGLTKEVIACLYCLCTSVARVIVANITHIIAVQAEQVTHNRHTLVNPWHYINAKVSWHRTTHGVSTHFGASCVLS